MYRKRKNPRKIENAETYGRAILCWESDTLLKDVVLCENCEHFNAEYHYCELLSEEPDAYSPGHTVNMYEDDYCSYGELKFNLKENLFKGE